MSGAQRTLTGETTNDDRALPSTMLLCEQCDQRVLRSRRDEHPHDLSKADDVPSAQMKQLEEKVPDHALVDTQTWKVTFHYEMVETVTVEAANKFEAKQEAEELQTYNGEIMETLHTEKRAWGEKSQASMDYLERYNLLPDDHDVTEEDIQKVINNG